MTTVASSMPHSSAKEIPISQQSSILAHRIQASCKTVAQAMEWMDQQRPAATTTRTEAEWEDAWIAVVQVCAKHRNWQQAVDICQNRIPASEQCRSMAISICGRCQQITAALQLLLDTPHCVSITTPAPYNAAIAACGTNRAWKEALDIIYDRMPRSMVTSLSANAVLTALAKSHRGTEALQFLKEGFDTLGVARDRISYHHTMAALMGQGHLDDAVQLVLTDMQLDKDVQPNQETFDRLYGAVVSKRGSTKDDDAQREHYDKLLDQLQQAAQQVDPEENDKSARKKKKRKHCSEDTNTTTTQPSNNDKRPKTTIIPQSQSPQPRNHDIWNFCKWELPKRGKGKTSFWHLGTITSNDNDNDNNNNDTILVGLHPNRNPSKNGIQLWFFREDNNPSRRRPRQKIGFLLMINTPGYQQHQNDDNDSSTMGKSQLLGLKVTEDGDRRKGWAKIFLAIWLQCCVDANLQPCTGKMNKPLLCLVLQHSFHFTPVPLSGGVRARILPPSGDDTSVVRLTTDSSSVKNLAGALTPRDVQEQNIQLVAPTDVVVVESSGGRVIEVGGLLQPPACKLELQESIDGVLGKNQWELTAGIIKAGDDTATAGSNNNAEGGEQRTSHNDNVKQNGAAPLTMSRLFLGV
ncbi:expressed unknown protein [Seminavis robusta]|uniref:Pentatricopeptide repeat-containing protein n=1 Tax=Seminavis robusta TaxID=568900 RepID=A0A9N8E0N4_9STRA|nr:expressed unknown protein [Seminavis robusta]|eukprot:Sro532_g161460.1 n/a (635) ;mRNA; f:25701-27605